MATHHPTPQVCPVLFIIATTNYNITLFFLTQESIMGCKEIRSRVRIYLFLNVSIKIIETIGATLLVINKVGPPFHCSARRPWERTTYVGYPEPSLWVFLCALTTESFLGRWRLFYWSCKWLYLPIKVKSCSFTEWPACSDCQLHTLLLKTSHFLVPPYHAFCKLLLTRIKSHLNLLSRIPTLSTLLQCS